MVDSNTRVPDDRFVFDSLARQADLQYEDLHMARVEMLEEMLRRIIDGQTEDPHRTARIALAELKDFEVRWTG